jgi:hypothetical protein
VLHYPLIRGFGWPSSVLWGFPFKDTKSCKFATMAKPKKKRAEKYNEKLSINGTFEDVIKLSVAGNPAPKQNKKKK